MRQLCDELQCPNICFVGDFNTGATNTFGGLLVDFCEEIAFIISDYALLHQDTFTYISDAHNTTYWIDRFVSSFSVHQAMFNMEVLTECIISDYRAVAVSIQCSNLPEVDEEGMEPQPCRIDWLFVTDQEMEDYYHSVIAWLESMTRLESRWKKSWLDLSHFFTEWLESTRVTVNDSRLESVISTKFLSSWWTSPVRLHTKNEHFLLQW